MSVVATGVAAMDRPLSRRRAATFAQIDRGIEPAGGRDGAAVLSDANALVKLQFEDWLPHDHLCVAGSRSVTSGAATVDDDCP
jgi:hypothetical protein